MRKRTAGWVPAQHGAWAMLIVPFFAGIMLRLKDGLHADLFLIPLFACWMLGYFAFNALSLWLKAAPARRRPLVLPAATYAGLSSACGLLTLTMVGPPIALWTAAFAPLLVPALILASMHRERATVGGLLTTAAASLMALVVRFPDPALTTLVDTTQALVTTGFVFAYFAGTVFYVKTNLRERGNATFSVLSAAWHVAWLVFAAVLGLAGWSWWWTALFVATCTRALAIPRVSPPRTPLQIGLMEIVLSVALCLIVALA